MTTHRGIVQYPRVTPPSSWQLLPFHWAPLLLPGLPSIFWASHSGLSVPRLPLQGFISGPFLFTPCNTCLSTGSISGSPQKLLHGAVHPTLCYLYFRVSEELVRAEQAPGPFGVGGEHGGLEEEGSKGDSLFLEDKKECSLWFGAEGPGKGLQAWHSGRTFWK